MSKNTVPKSLTGGKNLTNKKVTDFHININDYCYYMYIYIYIYFFYRLSVICSREASVSPVHKYVIWKLDARCSASFRSK